MRATRLPLLFLLLSVLLAAGCPKQKRHVRRVPVPTSGDREARDRFLELQARFERDGENVREELEEIVREYPEDPIIPHALLYAGMSAVRAGDYDEALADLEKLEEEADADETLRLRGKLYRGIALGYKDRHAEALPLLRAAEKVVHDDEDERAEWEAAMAEASAETGRPIEAIEHYDAWFAIGRPAERAYAVARMKSLVDTLDDAAVEQAWKGLDEREGPAGALLGERVATRREAEGDLEEAEEIRAESTEGREAIGMLRDGRSSEAGDPGRVGAVLPLTGRRKRVGDLSMRGLSLAAGSFRGAARSAGPSGAAGEFSLSVRDSASGTGASVEAMDGLADEGVVAVVGPMDVDAAKRAAERAAHHGLPMLNLSARPGAGGSRFVFHAVHSAEDRARALAGYAHDQGLVDFAIFRPRNAYGRAVGDAFRDEVERLGGNVVVQASYDDSATSFGDQVKRLRKPWQAVFIPDAARRLELVAPALAKANLMSHPVDEVKERGRRRGRRRILVLSTAEAVDERFLRQAGRYASGAVFAPGFYPDRKDSQIGPFVDAYFASFGRLPTSFEAYAYDAALAIRAAVEAGAESRGEVATALAAGRTEGLTGAVSFDSSRRRADRGVLYRVEKLPSGTYELRAMR